MKALLLTLALTAPFACVAHAAEAADDSAMYLGAVIGSRGNIHLGKDGVNFAPTNRQRALGLNAGYRINQHLALEAGYQRVGVFKFEGGREVDINVMYAAAKGSYAVSENFSLIGKLGVARTRAAVSGLGAAVDGADTSVKPMLAGGVEYRLSERFSLSLSLANYGHLKGTRGQLKMREAELGLNVRF
jgi:hypothetical protein